MSETPESDRSDSKRNRELLAAIMEFLELEDQGLTRDTLVAFMRRCEDQGPEFLRELKRCIQLAVAPPPEAVDEVERYLRSRDAGEGGD